MALLSQLIPGLLAIPQLKFYGITDNYKLRTPGLDPRLAYAQAVVHFWSA